MLWKRPRMNFPCNDKTDFCSFLAGWSVLLMISVLFERHFCLECRFHLSTKIYILTDWTLAEIRPCQQYWFSFLGLKLKIHPYTFKITLYRLDIYSNYKHQDLCISWQPFQFQVHGWKMPLSILNILWSAQPVCSFILNMPAISSK